MRTMSKMNVGGVAHMRHHQKSVHFSLLTFSHTFQAVHAGRGGVGNVRSPSRDPKDIRNQQAEHQLEAKLQREAQEKAERDGVVPTG